MKRTKILAGRIPIIGYVLRWISGILLLPRHLSYDRNSLHESKDLIKSLEASMLRANHQIIDLTARQDSLEAEIKNLRQKLDKANKL